MFAVMHKIKGHNSRLCKVFCCVIRNYLYFSRNTFSPKF